MPGGAPLSSAAIVSAPQATNSPCGDEDHPRHGEHAAPARRRAARRPRRSSPRPGRERGGSWAHGGAPHREAVAGAPSPREAGPAAAAGEKDSRSAGASARGSASRRSLRIGQQRPLAVDDLDQHARALVEAGMVGRRVGVDAVVGGELVRLSRPRRAARRGTPACPACPFRAPPSTPPSMIAAQSARCAPKAANGVLLFAS